MGKKSYRGRLTMRKLPDQAYRLGCRWCYLSFSTEKARGEHEVAAHGRKVEEREEEPL